MEPIRKLENVFFPTLALIAFINLVLVILRIWRQVARHGDPLVLLPLFTTLLAVVVIFVAYVRLRNGLLELSQQNDGASTLRLQLAAYTMALMAYVGIQSGVFHP